MVEEDIRGAAGMRVCLQGLFVCVEHAAIRLLCGVFGLSVSVWGRSRRPKSGLLAGTDVHMLIPTCPDQKPYKLSHTKKFLWPHKTSQKRQRLLLRPLKRRGRSRKGRMNGGSWFNVQILKSMIRA
eukprot:6184764-Pleurochrysis_carterae.AAC.1